jgi:hypothetical protein
VLIFCSLEPTLQERRTKLAVGGDQPRYSWRLREYKHSLLARYKRQVKSIIIILITLMFAMSGAKWTDEETAVAIMFDMWGINHKLIANLLTERWAAVRGIQNGRTVPAVRGKLDRIRRNHPELRGWKREAVYKYIDGLNVDRDSIHQRLVLTRKDIDMIITVCFPGTFEGRNC